MAATASAALHPVVLIPGIGGSILVKKGQIHKRFFQKKLLDNRWVNLTPFNKRSVRQWKDDMAYGLRRDPQTKTILGFDGHIEKEIMPYDVGGTAGVKDLVSELLLLNDKQQEDLENMYQFRYFNTLCEMLYANGYADHQTLIGLPYDFRLVLDPDYRERLFATFKYYIERATERTGKPSVVVAHSLGAILFKWFLSAGGQDGGRLADQWIEENVKEFVSICAPYGGAPNSIKAGLAGEHYIPFFHHVFREELQYNSGIIMCFPNEIGAGASDVFYEISGGGGDGSVLRMRDYDDLAKKSVAFEIWRDLYAPHIGVIAERVRVPVCAVFTANVATGVGFKAKKLSEYPYDTTYAYGDGVVPARSLRSFKKLFYPELTKELIIPNSNHAKIISDPLLCKYLLQTALGRK